MYKQDYEFNGFKYLNNQSPSIDSPSILYNKNKPENIFKYYALSKYSVDALVNGYLYASHPIELNDLLDSSPFLLYASEKLEYELYEKFLGEVFEDKVKLKQFYQEDINQENICRSYIGMLWEVSTNLFGIISTSENEFSPLMWPHYTQEKGFQIKFNTENLEKSIQNNFPSDEQYIGLYPVNYTEMLSPIDVSPYSSFLIPLYYATNIKSIDWDYEREWRMLVSKKNMGVPYTKRGLARKEDYFVDKKNRYVYYDKNLVEEITFGVDFFNKRDFEFSWLSDNKSFKVKALKSENNWEFDSLNLIMNYVYENLNDKLFYSGIKYELDEEKGYYLIRTKEKLEIERVEKDTYILKRTDVVKSKASL